MICQTCLGQREIWGPRRSRKPRDHWPCPECGGCGFTHCCEGDHAQPEPEEKDDE